MATFQQPTPCEKRATEQRLYTPPDVRQIQGAAAVEQVYDALVRAVYRYIYAKVGNREEAEDLTSQVFVKALRDLDPSRGIESMQAWIFQVARTTIADHWRKFYRLHAQSLEHLLDAGWDTSIVESAPNVEGPADERVHRLLDLLPPRYREVLTYRFLLSYTVRETAEQMQTTEANVKVLQLRALRRAAELERDVDGE